MLAVSTLSQQSIGIWFQTHGFVSWLLLGLVAGWLAGRLPADAASAVSQTSCSA